MVIYVLGPFYLIVEYCEKGSLLHYLRNSRLEENGYVNNRIRHRLVRQEGQKLGTMDSDLLTNRDLLSFAWQIAKGMRYLSEIKVYFVLLIFVLYVQSNYRYACVA